MTDKQKKFAEDIDPSITKAMDYILEAVEKTGQIIDHFQIRICTKSGMSAGRICNFVHIEDESEIEDYDDL
jgi:hypothetical protein